jgi:hypothetical protein
MKLGVWSTVKLHGQGCSDKLDESVGMKHDGCGLVDVRGVGAARVVCTHASSPSPSNASVQQSLPCHASSHSHAPDKHTPFSWQSLSVLHPLATNDATARAVACATKRVTSMAQRRVTWPSAVGHHHCCTGSMACPIRLFLTNVVP